MQTIKRPPSRLRSLEPAILRVLPSGLPEEVRRLYAACDGLTVSLRLPGGKESATLVGLARMFGGLVKGSFPSYEPVSRGEDLGERLASGPFADVFYSSDDELDDRGARARVDKLLRLRLLVELEGESAALGIDFYGGESAPGIYYVTDAREPHRLALRFEELVAWFERFGARRWYFAFLDKKSARQLNLDLAAELEASLAPFPAADVEALRAAGKAALSRAKSGAKPAEAKTSKATKAAKATRTSKAAPPEKTKAGAARKETSASKPKVDVGRWPMKPPTLPRALQVADTELPRAVDALLQHASGLVEPDAVPALVAAGLRTHLAGKGWAFLHWPSVALAAPCLTEDDVVALAVRYMPPEVLAYIARQRKWSAARLKKLASETEYAWKKRPVDRHVSQTFAAAAQLLKA